MILLNGFCEPLYFSYSHQQKLNLVKSWDSSPNWLMQHEASSCGSLRRVRSPVSKTSFNHLLASEEWCAGSTGCALRVVIVPSIAEEMLLDGPGDMLHAAAFVPVDMVLDWFCDVLGTVGGYLCTCIQLPIGASDHWSNSAFAENVSPCTKWGLPWVVEAYMGLVLRV